MFIRQNFEVYPNQKQEKILVQWLGQARFVWNHMLSKNIEKYDSEKKFLFSYDMNIMLPTLKKEVDTIWLSEIPAQCLQQKCQDLDTALKGKFKHGKGFPKFKSRNTDISGIRFPQDWHFNGNKINLPKMKGLKINLHRDLLGKAGALTLSRDRVGDFFVSILVKVDDNFLPEKSPIIENVVGIDLGLKEFAILSDGEIIKNPKFGKKSKGRLVRLQQSHSKKVKGSKNKEKSRVLLAKQHRKVARQRKDFVTQVACSIAKSNDLIIVEDLNIQGMVKNHKLAGSISDTGWGGFVSALKWQCDKRGKHFQKIDRWFPSSKTCSCCGEIKKDLTLSDRTYNCIHCGHSIDRDLNASINIEREGLRIFNTAGTAEINACQIRDTECVSGQEAILRG